MAVCNRLNAFFKVNYLSNDDGIVRTFLEHGGMDHDFQQCQARGGSASRLSSQLTGVHRTVCATYCSLWRDINPQKLLYKCVAWFAS
jgi:hypothetical protein